MSVPKKKISRRRTRARRSHHSATVVGLMPSPIAGDDSMIRPHHTHSYNGKLYTWKELKGLMKPAAPAEEKPAAPAKKKAATAAKAKPKS